MTIRATTFATTVFYVLPVDADGDGKTPPGIEQLQQCKYYVYDPDEEVYLGLQSSQLQAYASGDALDFVALQQLPPKATVVPPLSAKGPATLNATLYSATVKTLSSPNGMVTQPPSVYLATVPDDGSGALVVIPVSKRATRGVVLVFSVQDANGVLLRSTFDPEIKGSTNG
jgi:hypothetical protein